jgi:hypothetical protein
VQHARTTYGALSMQAGSCSLSLEPRLNGEYWPVPALTVSMVDVYGAMVLLHRSHKPLFGTRTHLHRVRRAQAKPGQGPREAGRAHAKLDRGRASGGTGTTSICIACVRQIATDSFSVISASFAPSLGASSAGVHMLCTCNMQRPHAALARCASADCGGTPPTLKRDW